jgi:hypothetical protein
MWIRDRILAGLLSTLAATAAVAAAPVPSTDAVTLKLPLKVEALTAPSGTSLPTWDTLELTRKAGGRFDIRLSLSSAAGGDSLTLPDADLSLLIPRVPRLARGSEPLTRLALIQREFNRNEVHNPMPDGRDLSIANNCLERGLWEVKLARSEAGKTVTLYHAWLTFPEDEYARLFREINGDLDWARYSPLLVKYPGVGGFALPLDELRRVRKNGERELAGLDTHGAAALDRLPEQTGKVKHIRTASVETYGDFARDDRQPITFAKFNVPGFYDPNDAMRFDLKWLGSPAKILWRDVESPRAGGTAFHEVEIRYANGYRILAADSELSRVPAREAPPKTESDVLKFVCGIGTPVIHATAAERSIELSTDRPRYLMILDAAGNHVDNHLTGVDGLYAWRDSAGALHLWLVSYERIAFVAHLSARLPEGL